MTNMDMSQYLGAFLDEAGDNLKHLDDLILAVEKDQADMGNIAEIFRSAHTLKGMSSTMGFDRMASLTHAMEDMLDSVRREHTASRRRISTSSSGPWTPSSPWWIPSGTETATDRSKPKTSCPP